MQRVGNPAGASAIDESSHSTGAFFAFGIRIFMTVQKTNQVIDRMLRSRPGISRTGYDLVIGKSLNGTGLIVRRQEADGRNADGAELIQRGTAGGNPEIAPAHESRHILNVRVNMDCGMR